MSKLRAVSWTDFSCNEDFWRGLKKGIIYLTFGKETCPTTQRCHLQGYTYFKNPRSFSGIKKLFPAGTHIEESKGSPKQNAAYCHKEGCFYEFGECPEQGKRNDIISLRNAIVEGKKDIDIIMDDKLCPAYAKYMRFADRVRELNEKEQSLNFRQLEVIVLYGLAGTGKTRYVYESNERSSVYTLVQAQKEIWFDGYCGEKILLIDDFYGWIKWAFLLKLLDGHQCRLNKKGATGWALWTKVYITSNKAPWEWYVNQGYPLELQRRINTIMHFTANGTEVRGNTRPALEGMNINN